MIKSRVINNILTINNYDIDYNKYPDITIISVTDLFKTPRQFWLYRRNLEIDKDVYDNLFAFEGTALHSAIEKCNIEDVIQEKRFYTVIDKDKIEKIESLDKANKDSVILTFKPDIIDLKEKRLEDIKTMSVYEYMYGLKEERKLQLNIYSYLLRNVYGFEIKEMALLCFFRDYKISEITKNKKYPLHKFEEIVIEPIDDKDIYIYIMSAIKRIIDNKNVDNLPDCSLTERWYNEKEKIYRNCSFYCSVRTICDKANIKE